MQNIGGILAFFPFFSHLQSEIVCINSWIIISWYQIYTLLKCTVQCEFEPYFFSENFVSPNMLSEYGNMSKVPSVQMFP